MNATFLVTIDTEAADPVSLSGVADDIHSELEGNFDVIDVKPWSRPSLGLIPSETQQQTGTPPVSGVI